MELGGVTGKGFLPGHSGNPGGRPKGLAALVREQTKDGLDPIAFLLLVLEGKVKGVKIEHRMAAAKELLDRGFGKPSQQYEHNSDGSNIPTSFTLIIGEKQIIEIPPPLETPALEDGDNAKGG